MHLPYQQRLHICSDIIEDSCVNGTVYPVLRGIPSVEDDQNKVGIGKWYASVSVHLQEKMGSIEV